MIHCINYGRDPNRAVWLNGLESGQASRLPIPHPILVLKTQVLKISLHLRSQAVSVAAESLQNHFVPEARGALAVLSLFADRKTVREAFRPHLEPIYRETGL